MNTYQSGPKGPHHFVAGKQNDNWDVLHFWSYSFGRREFRVCGWIGALSELFRRFNHARAGDPCGWRNR